MFNRREELTSYLLSNFVSLVNNKKLVHCLFLADKLRIDTLSRRTIPCQIFLETADKTEKF